MPKRSFQVGDWVIYRKSKHSPSPGERAQEIFPAAHGEDYSYYVDKFWVVARVMPDGRLTLRTRRGKEHVIAPDDPNLRLARWWEKLFYRRRFQNVERALETQ